MSEQVQDQAPEVIEIPADVPAPAKTAPRKKAEAKPAEGEVLCRVLKAGDGKISKGVHVASKGDETWSRNDVFPASREIAEGLEARGFVEFD